MNNETNGFKVLRRKGDVLASAVAWQAHLFTEYKVGEPASNPCGPLMFFPKLEDAERFARVRAHMLHHNMIEIWTCTTTDAHPVPTILFGATIRGRYGADEVRRWWNGSLHRADVTTPPPGTFVADAITLIERVQYDSRLHIDEDE